MNKHIGKPCRNCNDILTDQNATEQIQCKPCRNLYMREYIKKNRDKHNKYMYKWRANNKDKVRQMLENTAVKRFGSKSNSVCHYMRIYKEKLTDTHIKFLLCRHSLGTIKYKDIPQELIELKRKQVILSRQIAN
jgi:hypothetical protein